MNRTDRISFQKEALLLLLFGLLMMLGSTTADCDHQNPGFMVKEYATLPTIAPNGWEPKTEDRSEGFTPVQNHCVEIQKNVFHSQIACAKGGAGVFLPIGHNNCCKRNEPGKEIPLFHSRLLRAPPIKAYSEQIG